MPSFQQTLDQLRSFSESEWDKGARFERLMCEFFTKDPVWGPQFANVQLWADWAAERRGFDRTDTGIDLVAERRDGGYCAIQCKCYAPETRISKPHLDSFISASSRKPFTSRIVVDTGAAWGENALKTIDGLTPPLEPLHYSDLAKSHFDWPDLDSDPKGTLRLREPYSLRPHQQDAFGDVVRGLETHHSGRLVMACGTGKTFTALRIAEHVAGLGGRVLYLVPSISLLAQSMREWANQRALPHAYIGVCRTPAPGGRTRTPRCKSLKYQSPRHRTKWPPGCGNGARTP